MKKKKIIVCIENSHSLSSWAFYRKIVVHYPESQTISKRSVTRALHEQAGRQTYRPVRYKLPAWRSRRVFHSACDPKCIAPRVFYTFNNLYTYVFVTCTNAYEDISICVQEYKYTYIKAYYRGTTGRLWVLEHTDVGKIFVDAAREALLRVAGFCYFGSRNLLLHSSLSLALSLSLASRKIDLATAENLSRRACSSFSSI